MSDVQHQKSDCRACGCAMVWAMTPAGADAPIEAVVEAEGNVMLLKPAGLDKPMAVTLSKDGLTLAREKGVPLHFNHFARCPEREQFKRERVA